MNEQVKLAKIQASAARRVAEYQLVSELIRNPIVEVVALYAAVEYLQKKGVIPNTAGTVAEGVGDIAIIYQQLAPSIPMIAQSAGTLIESVGGALGGIAGKLPIAAKLLTGV